jgi:DNA-binding CsgD family transcriptional regulator
MPPVPHLNDALSRREETVLDRIVAGEHFKEIARSLGISHRTVESHRQNIRIKLGARNTADIVRIAMMRKRETA